MAAIRKSRRLVSVEKFLSIRLRKGEFSSTFMTNIVSLPPENSKISVVPVCLITPTTSCAAMYSGYIRRSIPRLMNESLFTGERYSMLSILATVFFAPNFLANTQASTFESSELVTAMKRSQLATPASFSTENEVQEP